MELWVRSQDKERLMKINGLEYLEYNDNHVINGYGTNECDNYDLGLYKTKKRAQFELFFLFYFIICFCFINKIINIL